MIPMAAGGPSYDRCAVVVTRWSLTREGRLTRPVHSPSQAALPAVEEPEDEPDEEPVEEPVGLFDGLADPLGELFSAELLAESFAAGASTCLVSPPLLSGRSPSDFSFLAAGFSRLSLR